MTKSKGMLEEIFRTRTSYVREGRLPYYVYFDSSSTLKELQQLIDGIGDFDREMFESWAVNAAKHSDTIKVSYDVALNLKAQNEFLRRARQNNHIKAVVAQEDTDKGHEYTSKYKVYLRREGFVFDELAETRSEEQPVQIRETEIFYPDATKHI